MGLESAAIIFPSNRLVNGEDFDLYARLESLVKCLTSLRYTVSKISILRQNDNGSLAQDLEQLAKSYDIVIVLLETEHHSDCVAKALAKNTVPNLVDNNNEACSTPKRSIGRWPAGTKILNNKSAPNVPPVIYFQRIFITWSEDQLESILSEHLKHYREDIYLCKMFHLTLNGSKKRIEKIRNDNLSVTFGKVVKDNREVDTLIMAAKDIETVAKGEISLREALGSELVSSVWTSPMSDLIYSSEDPHIKYSIQVIEQCLEEYGPENVFLSFNGGKDCTVLLHLVQTVLFKKYPQIFESKKLFCLYVKSENAFKEQDEFIEQCMIYYNLEIMSITDNIKTALKITLARKPHLKACFMGTRRTDPFCANMNVLQMTDSDWPQIMRCSPFLDWHFSDIWDYLLYYKVPYCKLYDLGFTSLGNAINTIRNPSLLFFDGDKEIYLPAYKMLNEKQERSGRSISKI